MNLLQRLLFRPKPTVLEPGRIIDASGGEDPDGGQATVIRLVGDQEVEVNYEWGADRVGRPADL